MSITDCRDCPAILNALEDCERHAGKSIATVLQDAIFSRQATIEDQRREREQASVPDDIYTLAEECGADIDGGEYESEGYPGTSPTIAFTDRQLEEFVARLAAAPAATAAPAALPGVRGYFSIDNGGGWFQRHNTLDEAIAGAQQALEAEADNAADGGWTNEPPQIFYGAILGECMEQEGSMKPAPEGSEFDYLVSFRLTDPAGDAERVVGHKTFHTPERGFWHEPLFESEANAILAECEADDAQRAKIMPGEKEAIRLMFEAGQRLKELGWNDACYCPKDRTEFLALEFGSTGQHRCFYEGEWPDGTYWLFGDGDMCASHPVLFKPLPADQKKATAWCPQCKAQRPYHGDPESIHLHLCDICHGVVDDADSTTTTEEPSHGH